MIPAGADPVWQPDRIYVFPHCAVKFEHNGESWGCIWIGDSIIMDTDWFLTHETKEDSIRWNARPTFKTIPCPVKP